MSEIPEHLSYTAEHEWVKLGELTSVGITAFAVEELGEIVFVELPGVGDMVAEGTPCGEVESTKARQRNLCTDEWRDHRSERAAGVIA